MRRDGQTGRNCKWLALVTVSRASSRRRAPTLSVAKIILERTKVTSYKINTVNKITKTTTSGANLRIFTAATFLLISIWPLTLEAGRLPGSRSLSDTEHGYQIVTGLSRAGKYSQRFEVRAGDCGEDEDWSD